MYVACSRARTLLVVLVSDGERRRDAAQEVPSARRYEAVRDWIGKLRRAEKKAYAEAVLAALEEGRSPPEEWPGLTQDEARRLLRKVLRLAKEDPER